MDGGAWWAAVHGVAKSRTRLSDFTFTFSLSCIGEGNGNPLQCSCLENPRDSGAWWADVYGVAQSRTRLKWLSSSSSSIFSFCYHILQPLGASFVAQIVKNPPMIQRPGFNPWVRKSPWRRERLPTPVFLLRELHGQRSLSGYSPWGFKELDKTEWLTHRQSNRWPCWIPNTWHLRAFKTSMIHIKF